MNRLGIDIYEAVSRCGEIFWSKWGKQNEKNNIEAYVSQTHISSLNQYISFSMKIKPTRHRYFGVVLLAFLEACGKQADTLPPETPIPTAVSPAPIPTSTLIPFTITPSPLPTQPIIPMITPDTIQVERWKEYEDALARTLSSLPREEVICEREILGRFEQEVYVWTLCTSIFSSGNSPISGTEIFSSSSIPAVIHLREDGSIQSVEIPGAGSFYGRDISRMFPSGVQEKFENYHFGRAGTEIGERLVWRRTHPEEPPLIVLIATQDHELWRVNKRAPSFHYQKKLQGQWQRSTSNVWHLSQ